MERPLDNIRPGSDNHKSLLQYLLELLEGSEKRMHIFYHRWALAEMRYQAYISLPDYEQQWKDMADKGEPPHPVRIIIPFAYAATSTLVTFLLHTFHGRRPAIQLGINNTDQVDRARRMEQVLQFNADHTRLVRKDYQHFQDVSIYGLGVKHINFVRKKGTRRVIVERPQVTSEGQPLPPVMERVRDEMIVYEGNEVTSIDPYMFFPDWRVPMQEVSRRGEFAFWRSYQSRNMMKRDEYHEEFNPEGTFSYIEKVPETVPKNSYPASPRRNLLSRGSSIPGSRDDEFVETSRDPKPGFMQVDQGCVWIVPKRFGLSDSDRLERWVFSIGNKGQIIQADFFDADHDQLPVTVTEPFGMGYSFGAASPVDYISPLQDLGSWLANSHVENVRAVLNNMIVYDPMSVEPDDMKVSGPGARFRLSQTALNRNVNEVLKQLPIADVTGQNLVDLQLVMNLGMMLLGFNQNLMGQTEKVSHTTATESRQSAEAGVSRLAAIARVISCESGADTAMQMVMNIQQHMSDDFWITVLGEDGRLVPLRMSADELVGEYQYVIHDGTLPLDRVALLNVWKELMTAVLSDQELRMKYDAGKVFEYSAELAGAKNIEQMRRGPEGTTSPMAVPGTGGMAQAALMEDGKVEEEARKGNLVPLNRG